MYNFKIIEQVLICLAVLVLDMSGEFKIIYFTSSNLLHDFSNDKYMLFSLKIIKKSSEKYGSTQPNPQPDSLDPSSTRPTRLPRLLKHFVHNLNESKLFMYKIKENVIEQRKIS